MGTVFSVPDDQIKLRLRSVIEAKRQRAEEYLERGWVKPDEPFVVAVNAARIPSARLEITIPRIVRCLLPFGHEAFHLDRTSLEVVDRSFAYQPTVTKRSGSPVSTDVFLDPDYSVISAVLYSCCDEINRPTTPGADFLVCRNPCANAPVPSGWLRVGWEYWVEDDKLHRSYHSEGGA